MATVEWSCLKHGETSFGFAFICSRLASGTGTGFNTAPEPNDEEESRPPALCDACEIERKRSGAYHTARVCGACYDEIKALRLR
jgi:hypothetical protein